MTESQVLHSATKGVHCNEKQAETQIENIGLDAHHTEFLLAHHGTTELEPLPPADAMHPLNWPVWRKNTFLIIFAIHGSMAGFTAAGLVPVLPIMATKYSKSLEATTYFASTAVRDLSYCCIKRFYVLTRKHSRFCCMVSPHSCGCL